MITRGKEQAVLSLSSPCCHLLCNCLRNSYFWGIKVIINICRAEFLSHLCLRRNQLWFELSFEGYTLLVKLDMVVIKRMFQSGLIFIKGIVHFEIKMWYLSAYPKGIQDVGVFFSSVDPILMFLGQTVLVCQSYNGRYRSLSL